MEMTRRISSDRSLDVYRLAFEAAMGIIEMSKVAPGKKDGIDVFVHEGDKSSFVLIERAAILHLDLRKEEPYGCYQ